MALVKGSYLGEVTALCVAKSPNNESLQLLLAGTGAQVDCYDLKGHRYFSMHVFDGVRVHGIHCLDGTVAVHGEGRVKVFTLVASDGGGLTMEFWQAVPRLRSWVLDVRYLQNENLLAIGSSDNCVSIWDLRLRQISYRVQCSVKCLLYSMRLWGQSLQTLRVAAGTIFNEVLVWTLDMNNISKNTEVTPWRKFSGHEGSIYRISWSTDGTLLGSVSDDRSARIWKLEDFNTKPLVLYGHTARVWDIHIDSKLLITASEDCTCRVWSTDGTLLNTLRGHVGRGIWRCIYDSQTAVLVTAGADASMKLYSLSEWASGGATSKSKGETEEFHLCVSNIQGSRDSKSEYVRCIFLVGPSSIYIGTNHGLIRLAEILPSGEVAWFDVLNSEERSPIVCMEVLVEEPYDFIASGDGLGYTTVLKIARTSTSLQIVWRCTWSTEPERQLLSTFWCKHLGPRFVFTTDPKGGVRCWYIEHSTTAPRLSAYFKSPFSSRIVCLDASLKSELLFCGDQRGNLTAFEFSEDFLVSGSPREVESSHVFKGAHGVSPAASISISQEQGDIIDVESTGRDGCICKLTYEANGGGFSCSGVEKVAAITVVEEIIRRSKRRIAAGFSAADFLLWDLSNGVELRRTACGGWRRPHSCYIGSSPEAQYCYAYMKDQSVYISRSWTDDTDSRTEHLHQLQKQSHGREIHTVAFIPGADLIISGSEDGIIHITRCNDERLIVCTTLKEQAGGSAVRALAILSISEGESLLLFSAGAKESLTCWQLNLSSSTGDVQATWLSTSTSISRRPVLKDDLRCMAITVFAGQPSSTCQNGNNVVSFLVIAMSNATLAVKAFETFSKPWRDVASLDFRTAPVLSLDHAVIDIDDTKRFYVFSGATDGTIAVWDLTMVVHGYSGTSLPQTRVERRPPSGRGSQGGRKRNHYHIRRLALARKVQPDRESDPQSKLQSDGRPEELDTKDDSDKRSNEINDVTSADVDGTFTIQPLLVRAGCHRSGVNCLHVCSSSEMGFIIVSGGDDQSLNFTNLVLDSDGQVDLGSEQIIPNAHASALKGVWGDASWVFSTGLDQRLRCWKPHDGHWEEACNCVIDVPEAAALHARPCLEGYQVAMVGRGMQIAMLQCRLAPIRGN